MGVDVSAEVMYGIWFSSKAEAKDYVTENKLWDDDIIEECKDDEDFDPCLHECLALLEWTELSYYYDGGGCLGVTPDIGSPETLGRDQSKVKEIIPNKDHHKLSMNIWARYH